MNFDVVRGKARRKKPVVGDVFSLQIKSIGYFFGIVAKIDALYSENSPPDELLNIIYIFKDKFSTLPELKDLNISKYNLLLPPPNCKQFELVWRRFCLLGESA